MNTNDLALGFDPTGSTNITGAQLGQLVTSATPSSDRGLILYSASKPDASNATGNPDWQRYIWIQQLGGSAVPYVWNTAAEDDVDGQKWQTVSQSSIGTYQVTGGINGNISLATITNDNIADNSISYNKLVDKPSNVLSASTVFAGAVSGVYGSLAITDAAVTTAKIANLNVTNGKIEDAAGSTTGIAVGKLRGSGTAGQLVRVATTFGGYGMEFVTPSSIATDAAVVATTANRVPYANGSGWTMSAPTGNYQFGRLMSKKFTSVATAANVSGAATTPSATTVHNATNVTDVLSLAADAVISSSGYHTVTASVIVSLPSTGTKIWAYLYNATGAVTPIAAVVFEINNGGTESDCLVLKARVAATAGATPTFYLAVASATTTASYCYLNSTATLEIEEYL